MRLWTFHPEYLDPVGLVAVWREALLAQAVLLGRTRGYTRHPQLTRFRWQPDPGRAMAQYLGAVFEESACRGYHFDRSLIGTSPSSGTIEETEGQLLYEWGRFLDKLRRRAPSLYASRRAVRTPEPHPMFTIVPGDIASWERLPGAA